MRRCIRISRFLAALLLAFLAWSELAVPTEAGQAADLIPFPERPTHVASRGGPRPSSSPGQGRDILVARPLFAAPTPTPLSARNPTPTPTLQNKLQPLGMFRVTGYSDSPLNGTDGRGITKSGVRTHWGVVAVDPGIIPLGSRLVIEGWDGTVFTAWDTGGGVKGKWVDIWFETDREALRYGTKERSVYLVAN